MTRTFGRPALLRFSYGFDQTFLGGDSFNTGHAFTASFTFEPLSFLQARSSYRIEAISFSEGIRSALRHSVGLELALPVAAGNWGLLTARAGYRFRWNEARTREFTHHRHRVGMALTARLRPGLLSFHRLRSATLSITGSFARSAYASEAVRGPRRDNRFSFGVRYETPVWRELSFELSIRHSSTLSTQSRFANQRSTVSASLLLRF